MTTWGLNWEQQAELRPGEAVGADDKQTMVLRVGY